MKEDNIVVRLGGETAAWQALESTEHGTALALISKMRGYSIHFGRRDEAGNIEIIDWQPPPTR